VVFTLDYHRLNTSFEFLAFVLFLESICKGQKQFGHSLGPSVKKNEFHSLVK